MTVRFLSPGTILFSAPGSVAMGVDCCCGEFVPCVYDGINLDILITGKGGNYEPIQGTAFTDEYGDIYGVNVTITQSVNPCVDAFYGTLTPSPIRTYLSGVTLGNSLWADILSTQGSQFEEVWFVKCGYEAQMLAGNPSPANPEWQLFGDWFLPFTRSIGGSVIIGQNTGAWAFNGSVWAPSTGSFSLLSLNPFHALGTNIGLQRPYPVDDLVAGTVNCGPVDVEFTE